MNKQIAYFGWLGQNNIGDDALYIANQKLFPDVEIIDRKFVTDSSIALFGGGTRVPIKHNELRVLSEYEYIFAIGVGVKHKPFRNQIRAPIDIGYFAHKLNLGHITNNKYASHLLNQLSKRSDNVEFRKSYIHEKDYEILHDFDQLGVRGPISKEILKDKGISSTITGDPALILEPDQYQYEKHNKIAINLRDGGLKHSDSTNYQKNLIQFCQSLDDNYEFVLLPFHTSDIKLHNEISKSIDNSKVIDFCSSIQINKLMNEISSCDLLIGEKLHSNVLAAAAHTPFISMGYQPKNTDFATSLNMGEFNKRIDELTLSWLHKKYESIESDKKPKQLIDEVEKKRADLEQFADKIVQTYIEN